MKGVQREIQRLSSSTMARNTGWMLAGQGGNLFLQAGYFVVLSRLLGSTEYGIFVGANALATLISTYSAMGSGTVLLRYVSTDSKRFAVYWGNILLTTTLVSAVLISIAKIFAPHLLDPASAALLVITGVAICFCGEITRNAAIVFQTFEKMWVTATLNLATSFLRLCAATCMIVFLHRSTAFQWSVASLIVSVLGAAASIILVTAFFGRPAFSPQLLIWRGGEGFGYSFASSTSSVYNDVDKTMLSHYGMNAADGIYGLAYRIIDLATIPVFALRDAAVPRLFRIGASSRRETKRFSFRLLTRAFPVSLLISGLLYLAAPLIPQLAGPSFAESVSAVRWLCLIPVFRSIHQMSGSGILGIGKQSYRTAAQILVAGVNFGLNLWYIPAYGWRGAAWTSLLADGMLAALNVGILLWLCRPSTEIAAVAHGGVENATNA
jgi:O-antigen/teichoic acid export membrane protein